MTTVSVEMIMRVRTDGGEPRDFSIAETSGDDVARVTLAIQSMFDEAAEYWLAAMSTSLADAIVRGQPGATDREDGYTQGRPAETDTERRTHGRPHD